MPRLKPIFVTALAALFAPALFALDIQNPPPASTAGPGTVNYIEGNATIDGQPVSKTANRYQTLQAGEVLSTSRGRAEVLLTPGIFFRLGHDSAAKMVSPDLTDTVIHLEHGRATVEVDQLYQENNIHVVADNVPVQLVKTGLYEFNADTGEVMVFSGKAAALRPNEKFVTIKGHHALNLNQIASARPQRFDEKQQENSELYRWSSLRSDYLAQANQQMAREYGPGYEPGWYWDPYMWNYTFLGAYPFYSPFGWGFYPFGYMGLGWGGGYWGGYYGPGYYRGGGHIYHNGHVNEPAFHRLFGGGGPNGGFQGAHEGGFHGGGAHAGGFNSGAFHSTFGGGGGHGR